MRLLYYWWMMHGDWFTRHPKQQFIFWTNNNFSSRRKTYWETRCLSTGRPLARRHWDVFAHDLQIEPPNKWAIKKIEKRWDPTVLTGKMKAHTTHEVFSKDVCKLRCGPGIWARPRPFVLPGAHASAPKDLWPKHGAQLFFWQSCGICLLVQTCVCELVMPCRFGKHQKHGGPSFSMTCKTY